MGAPNNQVPPQVVADAKDAFGSRALGSVLLPLVTDSLDMGAPADSRMLEFGPPERRVRVRVSAGRDEASMHIEVPAGYGPPGVERADGTSIPGVDHRAVAPGIVRVRLPPTPPDPALHTDWFRV